MKTINLSIPLATRLRNRQLDKAYRNDAWGAYTAQQARGVYYVEPGCLREVGYCDELARIDHKGWFAERDDYDAPVMRGVVFALPARNHERQLVAGYHYNGGDDKGATIDFTDVYDNEIDAARAADELARIAADKECDYQEQEAERMRLEEEQEAELDNFAACHPPFETPAACVAMAD